MDLAYYENLAQAPLFRNIAAEELPQLLQCLGAERHFYHKGKRVFWQGDPATHLGLLVEGQIQIVQEDWLGNRTILTKLGPHGIFAEAFVCGGAPLLPVSAEALQSSEVWLLDYRQVIQYCPVTCVYHTRLIANMLALVAAKSLYLNQRLQHLSRRSTREKVLSYLNEQAAEAGSAQFSVPFNRQELADYLCVERSALSAEISRMAKEGLLRTRRSEFELL